MTKDSQPDNKQARMEKCNYQTPRQEKIIIELLKSILLREKDFKALI